jgi:hypothetical protein
MVGSEAVDFMMKVGVASSRQRCVARGQSLVHAGLLYHVTNEHAFEDKFCFYRFYADDDPPPRKTTREKEGSSRFAFRMPTKEALGTYASKEAQNTEITSIALNLRRGGAGNVRAESDSTARKTKTKGTNQEGKGKTPKPRTKPRPSLPNKYLETPSTAVRERIRAKSEKTPRPKAHSQMPDANKRAHKKRRVVSPAKCLACAAIILVCVFVIGGVIEGWTAVALAGVVLLGGGAWKILIHRKGYFVWTRADVPEGNAAADTCPHLPILQTAKGAPQSHFDRLEMDTAGILSLSLSLLLSLPLLPSFVP